MFDEAVGRGRRDDGAHDPRGPQDYDACVSKNFFQHPADLPDPGADVKDAFALLLVFPGGRAKARAKARAEGVAEPPEQNIHHVVLVRRQLGLDGVPGNFVIPEDVIVVAPLYEHGSQPAQGILCVHRF